MSKEPVAEVKSERKDPQDLLPPKLSPYQEKYNVPLEQQK
jgi:hypothetical protein